MFSFKRVFCLLSAFSLFNSSVVWANPLGGAVVGGEATIAGQGTADVRINQTSDRAIINWNSFDIDKGERTTFQQPSANSVALNRVTGSEQRASQIAGSLIANGKVILVNPNGVMFTKDAKVDVAGLVASTADITNDDFMAGRDNFSIMGKPDARIQNDGNITVKDTGIAALVASTVQNNGVITAKLGKVTLAGVDTYSIDFYGDGLINYVVKPEAVKTLVENNGAIVSEDGTITLTATGAEGLLLNSGILKAGDVSLLGNTVKHLGTIDASNTNGKGGTVIATGEKVLVSGSIKADGKTGGGKVFVGGDYLGGKTPKKYADKPIKTAKKVVITKDATISVNATDKGNGGTAIVWSDAYTYFAGNITAHGGINGGNGGFIETSSYNNLQARGLALANARATGYKAGTWLLDPNNIAILSGSGASGNLNESPVGTFTTTNDTATIYAGTIQTALNLGTSVTIQTSTAGANLESGDITVAAGTTILKNSGGDATLTLKAHNSILFNGTVGSPISISSTSNKLNVVLNSDSEASGSGGISLTSTTINTNNGSIVMGGGSNPATTYAIGNAALRNGIFLQDSSFITNTGDITLNGKSPDGISYDNDGVRLNNTILQTTTGNISIYGKSGGSSSSGTNGILFRSVASQITTSSGNVYMEGRASETGAGWDSGFNSEIAPIITTNSGNVSLYGYDPDRSGYYPSDKWRAGILGSFNIATNTGDITVQGVSRSTYSGYSLLYFGGNITSNTGNVSITADGGNVTGAQFGSNYNPLSASVNTGGNITVAADSLYLAGATLQSGGVIRFGKIDSTAATTLNVGANQLNWYDSFLSAINTSTRTPSVILGSLTSTGAVTIATGWNLSSYAFPVEVWGGNITNQGTITGGAYDLSLYARTGAITLNASSGITTAGNILLSAQGSTSDITQNTGANLSTSGAGKTITLRADQHILGRSGASITTQGGTVTLNSDRDATNGGGVRSGTITTNGGNFILGGGLNPQTDYALLTDANFLGFGGVRNGTYGINGIYGFYAATELTGAITTNGGNVFINTKLNFTQNQSLSTALALWSDGNITTNGGNINISAISSIPTTDIDTHSGGTFFVSSLDAGSGNITGYGEGLDSGFYTHWSNRTIRATGNVNLTGVARRANVGYSDGGAALHITSPIINTNPNATVNLTGIGTGGAIGTLFSWGNSIPWEVYNLNVSGSSDSSLGIYTSPEGFEIRGVAGGNIVLNGTTNTGNEAVYIAQPINPNAATLSVSGTNSGGGTGVWITSPATIGQTGKEGTTSITGNSIKVDGLVQAGSNLLTITADTLALNTNISSGTGIIIKPLTASTNINIGSGISTSGLQLDNTELSYLLNTGYLTIGSASSLGTTTIANNWLPSAYSTATTVFGGNIITGSVNAGSRTLLLRANTGNITLNSGTSLTSTAAGDAITLAAAGNFINNSGSATPITVTGGGRYLVYSTSPLLDTFGTPAITRPNKRYNVAYGTSTAGLFSGASGFLYSVAPTITVTATAKNKIYGEMNPALTYTFSGDIDGDSGLLNGTLTTTAAQYSNVGSYGITQGTVALTTTASTLGYSIGYTPANLTITPRPVTVTADSGLTKIYGYSDPALSYAITSGSVINGDGFTGALSRTTGENIGNYALNAGTLSLGGNYTLSVDTSGKALAITPRPITVTADSGLKKQIRQNDPTLTYSMTAGSLVNGGAFTGALMRAAGENVGNYALNSGTLSLNGNYALTIDTTGRFFSIENDVVLPDTYLYSMQKVGTMKDRPQPIDSTLADTLIMPSMWAVENPVQVTLAPNAKPITLIAVTTLCINMPKSASAQCGAVTFKDAPNGWK